MTGYEFILMTVLVFLLWALKEVFVAYIEHKTAIHRINMDHTVASRYWEAIHQELQKQKEFNEQLLSLIATTNRNGS